MSEKEKRTYHFRVIDPDGSVFEHRVEMSRPPTLKEIRAAVMPHLDESENLEHVSVLHDGKRADMFVDERGIQYRRQRNDTATRIYRHNWMTRHPECDPEKLPIIVGPAVLFDEIVWT